MMADARPNTLDGRRIIVGVTGGIAAYKTASLVSRFVQLGGDVTVCMTDAAARFVAPLTFQALTGRPVQVSLWEQLDERDPQHIRLASGADLAVVAPATMDCLAKLAHGFADDAVSLVLSAIDRAKTPVCLAPSMNAVMWSQPATVRNIAQLEQDGFHIIAPEHGWQACRTVGPGRMAEPETILEAIIAALTFKERKTP